MNQFIVYRHRSREVTILVLSLVMLLLCARMLTMADTIMMLIIAVIALVFFGACTVIIVKRLVTGGQQLIVLTTEGFYDYSTATSTKKVLVPWREVEKIENAEMLGQHFVSVYLKDPEAFLTQLPMVVRKIAQANAKMGYGEININLQTTKNINEDELVAKMNTFLAAS